MMVKAAPGIGKLEHRDIKLLHSKGPMPHYKFFKAGEEVLVQFISGKHTIGRIMELEGVAFATGVIRKSLHVLFWTGRGSRCLQLGGYQ